MKRLQKFLKKNERFDIQVENPQKVEVTKLVKGEEIIKEMFRVKVSIMILENVADRGKEVVSKAQAFGEGDTIKAASRAAIDECLFRLGY